MLSFSLFFFGACQSGGGEQKSETASEAETEKSADLVEVEKDESGMNNTYILDTAGSIINWEGTKKFLDKGHTGTIKFKSGSILVTDGMINEGAFVVDMTTLDNTDLEGTDGYQKLLGHLKSDDFFGVDQYPTASFELNKVSENEDPMYTHTINGKLTIKGKTNQVSFPADVKYDAENLTASGLLKFDRTEFDIKYGSDEFFDVVKDKAISNEITLDISIKASTR